MRMPWEPKIQTLTWEEFFHPGLAAARGTGWQLAAGTLIGEAILLLPHPTEAAMLPNQIMMHAFMPIVSLIQGLAFPVSFLGMAGGMLLVSVGQRHKGIQMVKWAAVGYIGMQFVPGMMEMLAQAGQTIAHP